MALYPINKAGTGIDPANKSNTNWATAKAEMDLFIQRFPAEENFLIMEVEDLQTIVNRAIAIASLSGKPSYIACVFGKGKSKYDSQPQDKLTAILFPVIYDSLPGRQPEANYLFYKDGSGNSDRNNPAYIQQTWIDPTIADVPGRNAAVVDHFNS